MISDWSCPGTPTRLQGEGGVWEEISSISRNYLFPISLYFPQSPPTLFVTFLWCFFFAGGVALSIYPSLLFQTLEFLLFHENTSILPTRFNPVIQFHWGHHTEGCRAIQLLTRHAGLPSTVRWLKIFAGV